MRKICILFLVLFLTGCSLHLDYSSKDVNEYHEIINTLHENTNFNEAGSCFKIKVVLNPVEKQMRYDVILDEPTEEMLNIRALCFVEEKESDSIPSIGILEKETFHMKPYYVNQTENYYKGVNLSGITDLKVFHILIYVDYDSNGVHKQEKIRVLANEVR